MTTDIIKAKVFFALKKDGFLVHKIDIVNNQSVSYTIGALVTNDKASQAEENAHVIKEDYRIRQIEETP